MIVRDRKTGRKAKFVLRHKKRFTPRANEAADDVGCLFLSLWLLWGTRKRQETKCFPKFKMSGKHQGQKANNDVDVFSSDCLQRPQKSAQCRKTSSSSYFALPEKEVTRWRINITNRADNAGCPLIYMSIRRQWLNVKNCAPFTNCVSTTWLTKRFVSYWCIYGNRLTYLWHSFNSAYVQISNPV